MMPTCSSRRSPRPFTAGIPPILGTEPGVSSASAGTGGGRWAGARGEQVEGGAAGRKGPGSRIHKPCRGHVTGHSEEVPAPGDPSWQGAEQLSQPAHRFKAGGARLPRCVHAREGTHPKNALTCTRAICTHMRACAHTRTLTVHSRTHVRTHLHTHHTYAHTHPQAEPRGPWGATWEVGRLARPQTCRRPGPWAWRGHTVQQRSHRRLDPDPPGPGSAHCTPCTAELTCTPRHPLPGPAQTLQTPG